MTILDASVFNDAVDAVLSGYVKADGSGALNATEKSQFIAQLRSMGITVTVH